MGQFATIIQGTASLSHVQLQNLATRLLALFSLQGLLTFLDIRLVSQLGENLSLRLKRDLFKRLLDQDMSFFDERMHGEIVSRLAMDVAEFKHTFKICITQV